jgi:hypothetical protein
MIRLSQLITRKNIQLHQKENQRAITITQNAARVLSDLPVLLLVCIKPIQEQNNGKMPQLQKQENWLFTDIN